MTCEFKQLANNKVVGLPDGNVFSWCLQMDLLAISMNKTSIWVFRVDGERVYSINNKAHIVHFLWSPEGKYFVCTGTDRAVKVYDSNTGAHLLSYATHPELPISLVSWHSLRSDCAAAGPMGTLSLNFSSINTLKALPKLAFECELETQGTKKTDAVKDEQSGVGGGINGAGKCYIRENAQVLDFLVCINDNRSMSVVFSNSFVVPNILLPGTYTYVKHVMGRDIFRQTFVVRDDAWDVFLLACTVSVNAGHHRLNFLRVVELVVQMVSTRAHARSMLGDIARKAGEFIALYERHLSNYKTALDAEATDIDALRERIALELSNTLLTGLIPEFMQDFWLNQFGLRGLTRLSSVGNNAYDYAREVLYAQVILAAEKLIIILSDLESIAKTELYFQRNAFGISAEATGSAMAQLAEFVKDVYDFIWSINEEQELFNKFLNWCEVEVLEKLSKSESSPEEFFKTHQTLDFSVSHIIDYFNSSMLRPVFLHKLDLGVASDLFVPGDQSRLGDRLEQAATHLATLQDGLKKFIAGAFVWEEPRKLDVPRSCADIDIADISGSMLITAVEHNQVICVSDGETGPRKVVVEFPGRVVSSGILGEDQILVLHEVSGDTTALDAVALDWTASEVRYSDAIKLRSMQFAAGSFVGRPAYMSVTQAPNTHTVGIVVDATKKMYTVLEV
ncbi:hypothetical protein METBISCDRAFT_20952 [Metschnikowia bicuspidata]|uniref:Anaphase-promoting complex subunit 4 n=1 Tax=Metschnikowia bicuspidata TaxID=27322 RepID=A0A4P9ZJ46_9ASCO|nr:hypothetical protein METBISCDRAFT_20952 [Metschnikowia bicuspidata]